MESVKNYISGIKSLHYILDIKFTLENKVQLELMLKGMARKSSHMPNRALPITPQILNDMLNFLNLGNAEDATFWCCILFMFFF